MSDEVILSGRPYGGCAILWKRSLVVETYPVPVTSSNICVVSVESNGDQYLLCNVYMPCDGTATEEFNEVLDEIYSVTINKCRLYNNSW